MEALYAPVLKAPPSCTPSPPESRVPDSSRIAATFPMPKLREKKVPSEIRCIEMIRAVLRVAGAFHTGFGEFCRRSLQPTRHRDSPCSGTELWPCPPPRWHWTACQKLSPKRRRRKRLLETRAHCLQYVVVSLNWLNLGCPISPPPSACVGSHLSDGQHDMLERLEGLIDHFLKAPDISFDELGRAAEKLANLCKASFDLSAVSELDHQDLQNFLDVVSTKVDPYGPKYGKCVSGSCDISCSSEHKGDTVPSPDVEPWQPETLPARVPLANTVSKEIFADRIKWKLGPLFDPITLFV